MCLQEISLVAGTLPDLAGSWHCNRSSIGSSGQRTEGKLPLPKAPFAGPEQVLAYVARYTHRVAISYDRLIGIDDGKVRFRWRDYRNGNRPKTMALSANEFIRRFIVHVLPVGFPPTLNALMIRKIGPRHV